MRIGNVLRSEPNLLSSRIAPIREHSQSEEAAAGVEFIDRMSGTGRLIGWTSWESPFYHSLSTRTVFSFNLYDNKLARKGRDLLDLEAMVWSGLGAQNSYERMR